MDELAAEGEPVTVLALTESEMCIRDSHRSAMPDITITVSEELATRIQDYSAEFPHADRIIHDLSLIHI